MGELRLRIRAVLNGALHARDKASASALRSALAALENAEAVPAVSADGAAGSAHVAGAYVGVGTAESERRRLTSAEETAIVDGELAGLAELWRRTTDSATPIALPRHASGVRRWRRSAATHRLPEPAREGARAGRRPPCPSVERARAPSSTRRSL